MPSHYWGDKDFDWDSLYAAINQIDKIMRKYGRIGVHSKEKYGTARWSIYLCNNTLHSFTHPGYVYSQYPKWLWHFDLDYEPLKLISPLIRLWQKQIISYAFTEVCSKYPHIIDEIIHDCPEGLLPPHLELRRAKGWSRTCKSCDKWSTTDNYKCPHCGEIK